MCNLNKKLVLFDYTVEQLVKWDAEVTNSEKNEILRSFNFTRYMKLLYFICIESVDPEEDNIGLFETFGNFLAYENGPVEVDVYNNRPFLFRYKFNGDFLEERNPDNVENKELYEIYKDKIKTYSKEAKKISDTISIFRKNKNKWNFHMNNLDFLINLSHNLMLWKYARIFSDPIIDISISALKEEKKLFEKALNA